MQSSASVELYNLLTINCRSWCHKHSCMYICKYVSCDLKDSVCMYVCDSSALVPTCAPSCRICLSDFFEIREDIEIMRYQSEPYQRVQSVSPLGICIVLYCIVSYRIVLHGIVFVFVFALYCIVWNCIVSHRIVSHHIARYCIVLYCIISYCIALHMLNCTARSEDQL